MRNSICIISLLTVLLSTPIARGEDSVQYAQLCSVCVKERSKGLSKLITRLEASYVRYRWVEKKIRRLYYEDIWAARFLAMDPLDKKKREQGQRTNEELEATLRGFEKESDLSANSVSQRITDIQAFSAHMTCHPERAIQQCMSETYTPIRTLIDLIKIEFEHIFESERDYRKAVALTTGSKEGLYPQDSLEKPVLHKEYFWRFEQERSPKRYEEDARIIDFLNQLKKLSDQKVTYSSCCVLLEKSIEAPK